MLLFDSKPRLTTLLDALEIGLMPPTVVAGAAQRGSPAVSSTTCT